MFINVRNILLLFIIMWAHVSTGQVLLVINYNYPHYDSIDFIKHIYKPYFGEHIIFYGPQEHPNVHLLRHTRGFFSYVALADAMQKYPGYEGYLFLMDDCIINAWMFKDLDRTKIWFPKVFNSHGDSGPIDLSLASAATQWPWWRTAWGQKPTNEFFDNLPTLYKATLEKNWGQHTVFSAFADLIYIPARYVHDFTQLVVLAAQRYVFLEIALPTIASCLAPKDDWVVLNGQATYTDVKEEYNEQLYFNHPVKLSQEYNRILVEQFFANRMFRIK